LKVEGSGFNRSWSRTKKALKTKVFVINAYFPSNYQFGSKFRIGQPQGTAPTKNSMHGENNRRGRACACPQENGTSKPVSGYLNS